nr:uncharacterized protein CFP56_42106 [Quercus suber]
MVNCTVSKLPDNLIQASMSLARSGINSVFTENCSSKPSASQGFSRSQCLRDLLDCDGDARTDGDPNLKPDTSMKPEKCKQESCTGYSKMLVFAWWATRSADTCSEQDGDHVFGRSIATMGDWLRGFEISKPSSAGTPENPIRHLDASTGPSTRPLSDIRELTEPSLIDVLARRPSAQMRYQPSLPNFASTKRTSPLRRTSSNIVQENTTLGRQPVYAKGAEPVPPSSSSYSTTPEQSSFYAIPRSIVPQRSSSQVHSRRPSLSRTQNPSICVVPPPPPLPADGHTIPSRGRARSPVKAAQLRLDPVTAESRRRVPSRTCVRNPPPVDILQYRDFPHHRVEIELQIKASVFVGGGTIEGSVKIVVDGNKNIRHREMLRLCSISVDLLGYEEVGGRRAPFIALGTELIDAKHPPPNNMVESTHVPVPGDKSWRLVSSSSLLPFMITLPLDTGSPPFQSAKASITFLLSATAFVRVDGRPYRPVRSSQELHVLPTYDPEKALTCLQSPLTVSEEYYPPRSDGRENIKLTAGLHRQVWISGSSIFVDVHIRNQTRKAVRRLDLELERNVLIFKHSPTASAQKTATRMRIFQENHRSMVTMHSLRSGSNGWNGVSPHSSETRTCNLELPRGHATIQCGKYFEVCFFLNIIASVSNSKLVSVQLPVILIHINSLDVVPNSVAQVAAAMEEKRNAVRKSESRSKRRQPPFGQRSVSSPGRAGRVHQKASFTQGRAFAAPRDKSLDVQREEQANLQNLAYALDASPRKHATRLHGIVIKASDHPPISPLPDATHADGTWTPNKKDTPLANLVYSTSTPSSSLSTPDYRSQVSCSSACHAKRGRDLPCRPSPPLLPLALPPPPLPPPPPPPHLSAIPHSLGHASATNQLSQKPPIARRYLNTPTATTPNFSTRTATAVGFREKLDRSRFEFKAVRRKASGGLVERGLGWWEGLREKTEGKSKLRDKECFENLRSTEPSEAPPQQQREWDRAGWI